MTRTVKAKVTDHHFKTKYSIGDTMLNDREAKEVEVNDALRNGVCAGNIELVEGSLAPEKDEKSFQEDEQSGEESETDDENEEDLEELTKHELKELCEEKDLKKSGTKKELVERLEG